MAKAIEAGIPKMRIEEAAARTQARIDSGRQTIVGVNKYRTDEVDKVEFLKVDNQAVRRQQLESWKNCAPSGTKAKRSVCWTGSLEVSGFGRGQSA